jgi:hypothetical protein
MGAADTGTYVCHEIYYTRPIARPGRRRPATAASSIVDAPGSHQAATAAAAAAGPCRVPVSDTPLSFSHYEI